MSLRPTPSLDELLSAYLDGQVTDEERRRAEHLLATNPAAAERLAELRYAVRLMGDLPRAAAPRAFTLSEGQIGRRPAARRHRLGWLQPVHLRSAATLVAIFLLLLVVGNMQFQAQHAAPVASTALTEAPDEGDLTAVVGKRAPSAAAQPGQGGVVEMDFLGLSPSALLVVELALAVTVVLLLVASWQVGHRKFTP